MVTQSTECTPRERLGRLVSILARVRMYWLSTAVIAVIGVALSLAIALYSKRIWRSETTILYRDTLQTERDGYSAAARSARLGPKLKDMLMARGKLSRVIEELGLYPTKTARSTIEAVDELQKHIGFRARDSDTYVISFTHDDPVVAQRATARLAELLIEDYRRENLDSATMTRDFLGRELEDASARVDQASRALATFLAKNPQFQWGVGDSPYAPVPGAGAPGAAHQGPLTRTQPRQLDPQLAALERRLAQIDARLSPATAGPTPPGQPVPANLVEAQRARDAAAAAVTSAEAALAEKLQSVTPIHPDAAEARNRVESTRRQLAAAEGALRMLRAGVSAPQAGEELSPYQRVDLENERRGLLRQIAARRARVQDERAKPSAPAEANQPQDAGAGAKDEPLQEVVELETEWHRLRLELDRAREYMKSVQANERAANMQAEAAEKKSDTEMAILDPAYLPTRPDRGRGRIFFAGVAVSLLFAFGLAGARVLLNDTLYDEADVEAIGGPRVLAAMPEIPEVGPLRERAMIPFSGGADSTPPPAPVSEPPVRRHAETLRFGAVLPSVTELSEQPRVQPATALAVVRQSYGLARVETIIDEEPEVEVLGADLDRDDDGVFELLRSAPPQVLSALRVLRHRLDQRRVGLSHPGATDEVYGDADGHLVVAVVSPGPLEGKTALACRLAMTLAEAQRARVVLVEGNLERPGVSALLGLRLPSHAGLSHQIRQRMLGKQPPLGVIRVGPSLSVLAEPAGGAASPGVIHSPHFGAVVQALRRNFDYVVIDGPPVLGAGDANVIEDVSDGLVLVARASLTRASSLSKALEQLGGRRILGVVLNDVSRRPAVRKKIALAIPRTA